MVKFILPSPLIRENAMRELYRMNITWATLFPDLDGFHRCVSAGIPLGVQSKPWSLTRPSGVHGYDIALLRWSATVVTQTIGFCRLHCGATTTMVCPRCSADDRFFCRLRWSYHQGRRQKTIVCPLTGQSFVIISGVSRFWSSPSTARSLLSKRRTLRLVFSSVS